MLNENDLDKNTPTNVIDIEILNPGFPNSQLQIFKLGAASLSLYDIICNDCNRTYK
jgi:hypothetical protein